MNEDNCCSSQGVAITKCVSNIIIAGKRHLSSCWQNIIIILVVFIANGLFGCIRKIYSTISVGFFHKSFYWCFCKYRRVGNCAQLISLLECMDFSRNFAVSPSNKHIYWLSMERMNGKETNIRLWCGLYFCYFSFIKRYTTFVCSSLLLHITYTPAVEILSKQHRPLLY